MKEHNWKFLHQVCDKARYWDRFGCEACGASVEIHHSGKTLEEWCADQSVDSDCEVEAVKRVLVL